MLPYTYPRQKATETLIKVSFLRIQWQPDSMPSGRSMMQTVYNTNVYVFIIDIKVLFLDNVASSWEGRLWT